MFTYFRMSGFSQKSATFRPCSLSCSLTWLYRWSNSLRTKSFWALKLASKGASGRLCHSNSLSTCAIVGRCVERPRFDGKCVWKGQDLMESVCGKAKI